MVGQIHSMCVPASLPVCVHVRVCLCACVHACMCMCACACVHVCVHVCIHMCVHVCLHMCVLHLQVNPHLYWNLKLMADSRLLVLCSQMVNYDITIYQVLNVCQKNARL